MTKEELAKKKGIKIESEKASPSDALITTKSANSDTKKIEPIKDIIKPEKTNTETVTEPKQQTTKKEPKAGRPKGPDSTKISMNIPNESLELVGIAAGINYKGNISSYLNALIEKDIEENGKLYNQIKALASKK